MRRESESGDTMTELLKISLPDGSVREVPRGSTPADIAAAIGPGLAKAALAARVDGELRDLNRAFDGDAQLALVTARDEHVRAGVLQMWTTAPGWVRRTLQGLRRVLSALALGYLAWALLQYMLRMAEAGDRAPYIEVPLAWVAGFGAVALALSAWLALWVRHPRGSAA